MPAHMSSSALAKIPDNWRKAARKVIYLVLQVSIHIYLLKDDIKILVISTASLQFFIQYLFMQTCLHSDVV